MIGASDHLPGTSRSMPVTQTKKKSKIFVASRKDRLYDPVMPPKAPEGIAVVRAVILITVCGTAIWYFLWRLAEYVWAKR
jgi:hypothetical protein